MKNLTKKSKQRFDQTLTKLLKNPENHDFSLWQSEAEEKYNERLHSIEFEVGSQYTKSGNPELISLSDSDFE